MGISLGGLWGMEAGEHFKHKKHTLHCDPTPTCPISPLYLVPRAQICPFKECRGSSCFHSLYRLIDTEGEGVQPLRKSIWRPSKVFPVEGKPPEHLSDALAAVDHSTCLAG